MPSCLLHNISRNYNIYIHLFWNQVDCATPISFTRLGFMKLTSTRLSDSLDSHTWRRCRCFKTRAIAGSCFVHNFGLMQIRMLKISIARLFWSRPTIICVLYIVSLSSLSLSLYIRQTHFSGTFWGSQIIYHKSERIVTHSLTRIFVFLFDIVWVNYHKYPWLIIFSKLENLKYGNKFTSICTICIHRPVWFYASDPIPKFT